MLRLLGARVCSGGTGHGAEEGLTLTLTLTQTQTLTLTLTATPPARDGVRRLTNLLIWLTTACCWLMCDCQPPSPAPTHHTTAPRSFTLLTLLSPPSPRPTFACSHEPLLRTLGLQA